MSPESILVYGILLLFYLIGKQIFNDHFVDVSPKKRSYSKPNNKSSVKSAREIAELRFSDQVINGEIFSRQHMK